jgi:hypothetical protein
MLRKGFRGRYQFRPGSGRHFCTNAVEIRE